MSIGIEHIADLIGRDAVNERQKFAKDRRIECISQCRPHAEAIAAFLKEELRLQAMADDDVDMICFMMLELILFEYLRAMNKSNRFPVAALLVTLLAQSSANYARRGKR